MPTLMSKNYAMCIPIPHILLLNQGGFVARRFVILRFENFLGLYYLVKFKYEKYAID